MHNAMTGGIISSESERDGVVLTGVPREINAGSVTTPMLLADGKESPACKRHRRLTYRMLMSLSDSHLIVEPLPIDSEPTNASPRNTEQLDCMTIARNRNKEPSTLL